jgi:carbon-monoxide dehydrogenase large subunit
VRILRYVAAEDAGRAINPIVVEGQTHGAIGLGISGALRKRAASGADGQFLSGSFMDYALARAGDLPNFEATHMNIPTPATPARIKGMAEGGVLGAIGALMNAVNDALALLAQGSVWNRRVPNMCGGRSGGWIENLGWRSGREPPAEWGRATRP